MGEIEAQVVRARGATVAMRDVGEEAEAFADFFASAMGSDSSTSGSALADLAIVVFASMSGAIESFEGRGYARLPRSQRVANLAMVWHRPGHFEAVVAVVDGGKVDLTLEELHRRAEV